MRIVWWLNVIVGITVLWSVHTRMHADKTYVLTPFLDVVPEGAEWTPAELEQLQQHIPNMLEARDMARGYAHLGSTLNIDDVIQGIEGIEISDHSLSDSQRLKSARLSTNLVNTNKCAQYSMSCCRLNSAYNRICKSWSVDNDSRSLDDMGRPPVIVGANWLIMGGVVSQSSENRLLPILTPVSLKYEQQSRQGEHPSMFSKYCIVSLKFPC